MARPRPVAPPLTRATFPWKPSAMGCGCSFSATAPALSASSSQEGRCPYPKNGDGMERRRYGPTEGRARSAGLPVYRLPFPVHAVNYPMPLRLLPWLALALAGAVAWGTVALHRGETISAAWLVLAAVGTYLVAYRFYSRFLAERVFELNDRRATPAERL